MVSSLRDIIALDETPPLDVTAGYFAAEQETITAVRAAGSRFVGWQIEWSTQKQT